MRLSTVTVLVLASLMGVAACSKPSTLGKGASPAATNVEAAGNNARAGGFSFDADPCKAVLDAKLAQARAPAYAVTFTETQPGQPTKSGESRRLNGLSYFLVNGGWVSKAQSADELVQELKDISKDAKMSCTTSGDEVIGGQAATVYDAKIDNMDTLSESRMWISKTTGLPLKSHTQMEGGGVLDQAYTYSNVSAPPVGHG